MTAPASATKPIPGLFLVCAGGAAGILFGCFALIVGLVPPTALVAAALAALIAVLLAARVPGVSS